MNDVIHVMESHRSIRKFKQKQIDEKLVATIFKAAARRW